MLLQCCTNLQTVTYKNPVISYSGIMIPPKPDTETDSYFRLSKQTATVYLVDNEFEMVTLTRKTNTTKYSQNCTILQPLTLTPKQ